MKAVNRGGMQFTMVLLNHGTGAYSQDLVHPMARDGVCEGYALNVADDAGTEHLKAIGAFLGQRYSGRLGFGQVDNVFLALCDQAGTVLAYPKTREKPDQDPFQ